MKNNLKDIIFQIMWAFLWSEKGIEFKMGEKKVSLKEYILETVPKKLGLTLDTMSELEKARYIYIEICKVFSYNNIYNILDDENKKQNIFDEDIDINKYYIDIEHPYQNKLICSHMAKLYIFLRLI